MDIWAESSPGTGDSKCTSQDLLGIFVAGAEGVRERAAEAKSERRQSPGQLGCGRHFKDFGFLL